MAIFFTFAGGVIITAIVLEIWGRNALARRRRADMIAAAVRGEGPSEKPPLPSPIPPQAHFYTAASLQNRSAEYFELGLRLSGGGACLDCRNGVHGLPGEESCACACHAKVTA